MLKDKNLNLRVTSKTLNELETIRVLLGNTDKPLSKAETVERAISVLHKLTEIYWDDIVHFSSDYPEIAELVLNVRFTRPVVSKPVSLVAENITEYNSSNN